MNKTIKLVRAAFLLAFLCLLIGTLSAQNTYNYNVSHLKSTMVIDANWDKPEWKGVDSVSIDNYMGTKPKFIPKTYAKVQYSDSNIYVIFKVYDKYVSCIKTEHNSPVYEDACVEFFFSPNVAKPLEYFNIEVNSGGICLARYNTVAKTDYTWFEIADIEQIEIAHSLPALITKEITDSVIWTLETRIPLAILSKYATITSPENGVVWKGNFFKTADKTSNPHYITWAKIAKSYPDFHVPEYFGNLVFDNQTAIQRSSNPQIKLLPNPATNYVSIFGASKAAKVRIVNMLGNEIAYYVDITDGINISELKAGIYFVVITDGKNTFTQKLIKAL